MIKRLCSILLTVMLVLSFAAPAFAAIPRYSADYSKTQLVITAKKYGVTGCELTDLKTLAYRESRYRNWVTNGSCKGLFQIKTSVSYWYDPAQNTRLAIKYIKARYGTVHKALAHQRRLGWY